MKDKENTSLLSIVNDPDCSAETLEELIGKDVEVDRIIASHLNARLAALKELLKKYDHKTRENVTGNPNATIEFLLENYLITDFPRAFLLNPAFDWMIIENPDFLKDLDQDVLAEILKQKECPSSIIDWAFTFYSKRGSFSLAVMKALTQNPEVKINMIEKIVNMDIPYHNYITGAEGAL